MNLISPLRRSAAFALAGSMLAVAAWATQSDFEVRALDTLSLQAGSITDVSFQGAPGEATEVALDYQGQKLTLDLYPHSAMAPDGRILEDRGTGELVEVQMGLVRTYRGSVKELPASVVAGAWLQDGFWGRIREADGSDLWIQPLIGLVEGASASQHVVYRSQDILEQGFHCGGGLLPDVVSGAGFGSGGGAVGGQVLGVQKAAATFTAEVGIDADFEYFQSHGSNSTTTSNQINLVIDTMNLQYERDVDITHVITTIIVRTTSNDPYSSTDPNALLTEFMTEWNSNQGGVQRDFAHLFTGKNVNGGVIGIGFVGVVCNLGFGYSVVQSDFNNNFGCATDLSAHEIGHNWNASHCTCASNTMNAFITCANIFHPTFTIPTITAFRDSRNCLDVGNIPPTAGFSGTPLNGFAPLIVTFTDQSSGIPTSWFWDFGDGNTSTFQNVGNAYVNPGTYTVSLTATNSTGSDTLVKTNYVVVDGPVVGSCVGRNGTGANPNIFSCSNTPSIGQTWTATIDAGSVGLTGLSFIFGFSASSPPLPTGFGEVLIDPSSSFLLLNISLVIGGTATHSEAIPADNSLIGLVIFTQGFLNQGVLTNAIDLTVGS